KVLRGPARGVPEAVRAAGFGPATEAAPQGRGFLTWETVRSYCALVRRRRIKPRPARAAAKIASEAGSGTLVLPQVPPNVHWLSKEPISVCHLKSKSSGDPTEFAPRSIEVALSVLRVSVSVNVLVAPGARSPPPPPAQVGPVEAQTSTVWKLGKFELRKVSKTALLSPTELASGKMLKPNAVSRPDGNRAALVRFATATVIVNVVVVPGEE